MVFVEAGGTRPDDVGSLALCHLQLMPARHQLRMLLFITGGVD
jgi:hypothetical protein